MTRASDRTAAGTWLATRVVLFGFTVFAGTLLAYLRLPHHHGIDLWRQWDTGWYLAISQLGYYTPQAAAFFPFYPTVVGALTWVSHDESLRLPIALALSNLGALAGFIGVARLAARELGQSSVAPSLRMLAAYPFAFFLAAGYTEGLFLAFAAFALYWAREGRWGPAAGAAFLAGLTRNTGVILVLPLAWEFASQAGWWTGLRSPRRLLAGIGVAVAAPAGLAVYVLYLWRRFGDPLLYVHAERRYWHRELQPVWQTIGQAADRLVHNHGGLLPIDLGLVIVFLLLTLIPVRRQPVAFTLYMLGVVYTAVALPQPSQHDLIPSAGRYLTVGIPAFLVLGSWVRERPGWDLLVTAGGFMLQAGLLATFLAGGPVF